MTERSGQEEVGPVPGEGIVEEQMGDGPVMSLLGFLALCQYPPSIPPAVWVQGRLWPLGELAFISRWTEGVNRAGSVGPVLGTAR